jgi:hypothetical protein
MVNYLNVYDTEDEKLQLLGIPLPCSSTGALDVRFYRLDPGIAYTNRSCFEAPHPARVGPISTPL